MKYVLHATKLIIIILSPTLQENVTANKDIITMTKRKLVRLALSDVITVLMQLSVYHVIPKLILNKILIPQYVFVKMHIIPKDPVV